MTEPVGDSIRSALEALGGEPSNTHSLEQAWPAAVGPENARVAWPAKLGRDGTLHVNTRDATWAFQLGMLAEEILANLRAELGEATPRALRFAPGPLPEAPSGTAPTRVEPSADDRADGVAIAAAVEDPELRELVARTAAASLARARSARDL